MIATVAPKTIAVKDNMMKTIDELFRDGKEIDTALRIAVQQTLQQHKKAGNPVAEWRDGKAVLIRPEDIVVEEKQK